MLATVSLLSMMRRRQLLLVGLLKDYIQRQLKWARCRAKAEVIAAARQKEQPVNTNATRELAVESPSGRTTTLASR